MKLIFADNNPHWNRARSARLHRSDDSALIVDFPTMPRSKTMADPVLKRVSFSAEIDSVVLFSTSPVSSRGLWYNKKENKMFQRDTSYNILAIRGNTVKDEDDNHDNLSFGGCCVTGIERVIYKKTIREISSNKELHKWAVIDEYWRQLSFGRHDPEALRNVSRKYSTACEKRARSYAFELAQEMMHEVPVPENTALLASKSSSILSC